MCVTKRVRESIGGREITKENKEGAKGCPEVDPSDGGGGKVMKGSGSVG